MPTKWPENPSKEEFIARVKEASKYIDINQLCISGQCGFARSHVGNKISFEDQDTKIKLLLEVAQEVWGTT
jgi:5-methyltetrahydropteroyltriglutamate--homocysteine methyltransferase